jgi:hypothetical protein
MLLDGVLVAQSLINRDEAEKHVSVERLAQPEGLRTVLDLITVETWLKPWSGVVRL